MPLGKVNTRVAPFTSTREITQTSTDASIHRKNARKVNSLSASFTTLSALHRQRLQCLELARRLYLHVHECTVYVTQKPVPYERRPRSSVISYARRWNIAQQARIFYITRNSFANKERHLRTFYPCRKTEKTLWIFFLRL